MKTKTKTNKIYGVATCAAMLAAALLVPGVAHANSNTTMKTLAGTEGRDTAVEIAKEAFDGSEGNTTDTVVIATDNGFADAMSSTGLAGAVNAPILLTNSGQYGTDAELNPVNAAINALKDKDSTIKNVYIIGGSGVISSAAENTLAAKYNVTRIYGTEACDTSVKCAEEIAKKATSTNEGKYAIVANANNFQDAVSMSSFAYKYKVPIFLTEAGSTADERTLTNDALELLTTKDYKDAKVFVVGGTGALSTENVEGAIAEGRSDGDSNIENRLAGEEGYDTSNQIAKYMTKNNLLNASTVTVACGAISTGGTDALAGAALAGKNGGVVLLTNSNKSLDNGVKLATIKGEDSTGTPAFVASENDNISKYYVLGGSAVCSNAMKSKYLEHKCTAGSASSISATSYSANGSKSVIMTPAVYNKVDNLISDGYVCTKCGFKGNTKEEMQYHYAKVVGCVAEMTLYQFTHLGEEGNWSSEERTNHQNSKNNNFGWIPKNQQVVTEYSELVQEAKTNNMPKVVKNSKTETINSNVCQGCGKAIN